MPSLASNSWDITLYGKDCWVDSLAATPLASLCAAGLGSDKGGHFETLPIGIYSGSGSLCLQHHQSLSFSSRGHLPFSRSSWQIELHHKVF